MSLDRDNGTKAPVCAWPVSIGPTGVERVTRPDADRARQVVVDEGMNEDVYAGRSSF